MPQKCVLREKVMLRWLGDECYSIKVHLPIRTASAVEEANFGARRSNQLCDLLLVSFLGHMDRARSENRSLRQQQRS